MTGWAYGDCGFEVVEREGDHGPGMGRTVHLGPDVPQDRCEI